MGKSIDDKTIWKTLPDDKVPMSNNDLIEFMINNNSLEYNKLKAAEELMELALVLQQQVLKPSKVTDKQVTDEIGDVIIRMKVLKRLYLMSDIKKRLAYKTSQFKGSIINGEFGNRIKNI